MDASIVEALQKIASQLERVADALDTFLDCVRVDDAGKAYLNISPEVD